MTIHTVRVRQKGTDIRERDVLLQAVKLGVKGLTNVQTAKIYRVEGVSVKQARKLSQNLFCELINQECSLDKTILDKTSVVIEIAYKPGVMNPEVASIMKAAKDLGINIKAADSSSEYAFYGNVKKEEIEEAVKKLNLFNPTVEYLVKVQPKTLIIKGVAGKTTTIPIRKMADVQLLELSKDKLFLNLEEMKIIQKYFTKIKRDPKDIELETLAQTWSEHCAHKTFKAKLIVNGKNKQPLIERLKKEALKHNKNILSAFVDNAGVMEFYDGLAICGKVETHNSPSAIEPYGGAATGSGGVFRDVAGTAKGAKTIASTDIFCFANPDMRLSKLPTGCLPPKYLLKRVVKGVQDYGNRMGIPTNNGSVHFHDDFRAKPTIIVGAYGILPRKSSRKAKVAIGDIVIAVGGKTGRDGIHGATFSSAEMTDRTINVNSTAVQIGNAIEEKRMFDALDEARGKKLIKAIQDCGAGGFSSAVGEMGEKTGATIHLEKAPLKYQGLSPWEIWISESQERMIVAVTKERLKEFLEICKKYNTECTILGYFDGGKKLKVYFEKQLICNLDMKFLHHGLPQRTMKALGKIRDNMALKTRKINLPKNVKEWILSLKRVLSHGNVCSKEPILRLYDHTVQGTNVLQPFGGEKLDGPNNAVVLRPILNKPYGMIIAHGLNPVFNNLNPYWGSIWAATEAIANYVSVGGDYRNASLINNYIWPFPDEESLWSLDRSVDSIVDFMKILKIPVISGKDSLSSTYKSKDGLVIKIPPVLCISVFGKIPDVAKTCSCDLKKTGSTLVLVGKMDWQNMAGSVYSNVLNNLTIEQSNNAVIPRVDLKLLPKVLNSVYQGIKTEKIFSCHDISEGGLITTLFEMCAGGNIGVRIVLNSQIRPDYFLFNETAGCFVIELENKKTAKELFKDVPYLILGQTQKEKLLTFSNKNEILFSAKLDDLKKDWQKLMKKIFD